jgi:hypothetical protein
VFPVGHQGVDTEQRCGESARHDKGVVEKSAPNPKQKLNDTIATLDLPTKPKGETWSDLEAWWNQLSDKELTEVMRGFSECFHSTRALEDASEIEKWDRRIAVIEEFPMFKDIPRDFRDADVRPFMDDSDESAASSIVHVQV